MAVASFPILSLSVKPTAALAQYQPVQATGAPATAAGNVLGFTTVSAAATDPVVTVRVLGTCIAVAGAAISAGALVEVHTTVTQVVTKVSGVSVGRALTAASNAGDFVEILLLPN